MAQEANLIRGQKGETHSSGRRHSGNDGSGIFARESHAPGRTQSGGGERGRGRPKAVNPKQRVSLRLAPRIVASWKGTGPGWQSRISDVLAAALPKRTGKRG